MADINYDEEREAEERIDRFHDGYFAFRRGEPRPTDPCAADGWDDAERASQVRVVMPARPEGYYHCAPGTFD